MFNTLKIKIIGSRLYLTVLFSLPIFIFSTALHEQISANIILYRLFFSVLIGLFLMTQYRRANEYVVRKLEYGQTAMIQHFFDLYQHKNTPNYSGDYEEYKAFLQQHVALYRAPKPGNIVTIVGISGIVIYFFINSDQVNPTAVIFGTVMILVVLNVAHSYYLSRKASEILKKMP